MLRSQQFGPGRENRRGAVPIRLALVLALPLLASVGCASRATAPGEAVIPERQQQPERLPPWPTRGPVMVAGLA